MTTPTTRRISSEYPWQLGPDWGKREGVVAVLDIDGHRFEIRKYMHGRRTQASYHLKVDGEPRGSTAHTLQARVSEADGMVSWSRLSTAIAQASAEGQGVPGGAG